MAGLKVTVSPSGDMVSDLATVVVSFTRSQGVLRVVRKADGMLLKREEISQMDTYQFMAEAERIDKMLTP